MKFAFEIKTKLVVQVSIIAAVVAFSSGSLALIVIYLQSPLACTFCAIILVVIVYSLLCLPPH
jgi:hypothetical protein